MIFSLLKMRKKTSAVLAGIVLGAGSLWALSLWYDIPRQELISILGTTVMVLLLIILLAIGLITLIKLAGLGLASLSNSRTGDGADNHSETSPAQQNLKNKKP